MRFECKFVLACHLLGIETTGQLSTHFALGALFENLIIMEIYKQRLAKGTFRGLYFWRDNKGLEVDLLLEVMTEIHPYEIKAGRTFNASFFHNLTKWRKLSGNTRAGTVIYGGNTSQQTQAGFLMSWKDIIPGL